MNLTPSLVLLFNFVVLDAQQIANQKCREYGNLVYANQEQPVLSRFGKKIQVSECGIASVPLIIGGTKAGLKEFPHAAVLGYGTDPLKPTSWVCGGTLISELFVLTAAHCAAPKSLGECRRVKVGMRDVRQMDADVQMRNVVKLIYHPEYVAIYKLNDVALLRMDTPVQFTAFVRPACLNTNIMTESPGNSLIAIGIGKMDHDHIEGSKELMKVNLNVYKSNMCDWLYKNELQQAQIDRIVCAGEIAGGRDTCQGDSGGPLQTVLQEPYCMYSIVGITSFGRGCGFPNAPAVYMKVSYFVPWIEQNVWMNY